MLDYRIKYIIIFSDKSMLKDCSVNCLCYCFPTLCLIFSENCLYVKQKQKHVMVRHIIYRTINCPINKFPQRKLCCYNDYESNNGFEVLLVFNPSRQLLGFVYKEGLYWMSIIHTFRMEFHNISDNLKNLFITAHLCPRQYVVILIITWIIRWPKFFWIRTNL